MTANPAPGFAKHPDHTIAIADDGGKIRVLTPDGAPLAETSKARRLEEKGYPPVLYIPFADIDFSRLERSQSRTACPFKGEASYWRLAGASKDVMWAYETPYDEMRAIADHGAFYPDRVRIVEGA